ncbi:hypothetical protein [Microcoleus sp. FACHB-831]|nr:hypothetical protein [Microcoleus sp. FACHB-831]
MKLDYLRAIALSYLSLRLCGSLKIMRSRPINDKLTKQTNPKPNS